MGVANTLALVVERIGVLAAQFNLFFDAIVEVFRQALGTG